MNFPQKIEGLINAAPDLMTSYELIINEVVATGQPVKYPEKRPTTKAQWTTWLKPYFKMPKVPNVRITGPQTASINKDLLFLIRLELLLDQLNPNQQITPDLWAPLAELRPEFCISVGYDDRAKIPTLVEVRTVMRYDPRRGTATLDSVHLINRNLVGVVTGLCPRTAPTAAEVRAGVNVNLVELAQAVSRKQLFPAVTNEHVSMTINNLAYGAQITTTLSPMEQVVNTINTMRHSTNTQYKITCSEPIAKELGFKKAEFNNDYVTVTTTTNEHGVYKIGARHRWMDVPHPTATPATLNPVVERLARELTEPIDLEDNDDEDNDEDNHEDNDEDNDEDEANNLLGD